jgi:hypothetical protein
VTPEIDAAITSLPRATPGTEAKEARMAVMKSLQVTRRGPLGEVLEVRSSERPEPAATTDRYGVKTGETAPAG